MKTKPPKIPKGWRKLRAGTRLLEGDRHRWDGAWHSVVVCGAGNYACNPYTYIRREPRDDDDAPGAHE